MIIEFKDFTEDIKRMVQEAISTSHLPQEPCQRLIGKKELAEALGISVSMVDTLRREGIIQGYKIGKGQKVPVRFDLDETISNIKAINTQ